MVIAALPCRARYRTRLTGLVTCLWLARGKAPRASLQLPNCREKTNRGVGEGRHAPAFCRRCYSAAPTPFGNFLPMRSRTRLRPAEIRRGRSDRRSSPCSRPPRSRPRTSASSRHFAFHWKAGLFSSSHSYLNRMSKKWLLHFVGVCVQVTSGPPVMASAPRPVPCLLFQPRP